MKRAAPWESCPISSDDSSELDSEDDKLRPSKNFMPEAPESRKKRHGGLDYEALSKHGYSGGPSVLKIRPKVEEKEQDWSWSTGKQGDAGDRSAEESYEERERTRAAALLENLPSMQANLQERRKEKSTSFSQKEKRKRDLGQASRGKNYVEEEKRLLRNSEVIWIKAQCVTCQEFASISLVLLTRV